MELLKQDKIKLSRKDQNKRRVVQTALTLFVEKGIENTTVAEIADEAGLTERSLFRFFDTKSDLVAAAALLMWKNVQRDVTESCSGKINNKMCGAEQIPIILKAYAQLYFTSSKELIFIHETEAYLYRMGKYKTISDKPPYHYNNKTSLLANAITKGLRDGSVRADIDHTSLYYNTYDALLGIMQKMTIANDGSKDFAILARARINLACETIAKSFV